jgi:hypothetical protein
MRGRDSLPEGLNVKSAFITTFQDDIKSLLHYSFYLPSLLPIRNVS